MDLNTRAVASLSRREHQPLSIIIRPKPRTCIANTSTGIKETLEGEGDGCFRFGDELCSFIVRPNDPGTVPPAIGQEMLDAASMIDVDGSATVMGPIPPPLPSKA
jgi:hypothetical protein